MTLEARFQDEVLIVDAAGDTVSVVGGVDQDVTRFIVEAVDDQMFRITVTSDDSSSARSSMALAVRDGDSAWVFVNGEVVMLELQTSRRRSVRSSSSSSSRSAHEVLTTPMPATVVRLCVAPRDRVTKNMPLVILEAMKMELPLRAPRDGVVRRVMCREGELVQPGPPLVELE